MKRLAAYIIIFVLGCVAGFSVRDLIRSGVGFEMTNTTLSTNAVVSTGPVEIAVIIVSDDLIVIPVSSENPPLFEPGEFLQVIFATFSIDYDSKLDGFSGTVMVVKGMDAHPVGSTEYTLADGQVVSRQEPTSEKIYDLSEILTR